MKYWAGAFGCYTTPEDFEPLNQDGLPWVEITKEEYERYEKANTEYYESLARIIRGIWDGVQKEAPRSGR